jgi:hypothetical protein
LPLHVNDSEVRGARPLPPEFFVAFESRRSVSLISRSNRGITRARESNVDSQILSNGPSIEFTKRGLFGHWPTTATALHVRISWERILPFIQQRCGECARRELSDRKNHITSANSPMFGMNCSGVTQIRNSCLTLNSRMP